MSVLIKGMEMPKAGAYSCELGVLDENTAVLTVHTPIGEPQVSYRLIPVPDHGRLGDLDELKRIVKANDWSNPAVPAALNVIITRMPTIIPADKEGEG